MFLKMPCPTCGHTIRWVEALLWVRAADPDQPKYTGNVIPLVHGAEQWFVLHCPNCRLELTRPANAPLAAA